MKLLVVTVGMGFGDEGKGGTVDFLTRDLKADLVIRYSGGCQCGHNVVLPNGTHHQFSQFGAGTFAGAGTFITGDVVIDIPALCREGEALKKYVPDAFRRLRIAPDAILTTAYTTWLNRAEETARAPVAGMPGRHGSCGRGIWAARRAHANGAGIYARDMARSKSLRRAFDRHLEWVRGEIERQGLVYDIEGVASPYRDVDEEFERLWTACRQLDEEGAVVTPILPPADVAIAEGAQGIALDAFFGAYPHQTAGDITSRSIDSELAGYGWNSDCELFRIGVTRSYTTRHGAGPFPTIADLHGVGDRHNPTNPWQGDFRTGYLDLPLLRYANALYDNGLDGVFLTHADAIEHRMTMLVAERYRKREPVEYLMDFVVDNGRMPDHPDMPAELILSYGEGLHELLTDADPINFRHTVHSLIDRLEYDNMPVLNVARGPTHADRKPTSRYEDLFEDFRRDPD